MADPLRASSLWYTAPGVAAFRETLVQPAAGELLVRARWSAISRGTERLVYRGLVPKTEQARMACPRQEGSLPFPVKYGYAMVGETAGGAHVFCLNPHETAFSAPADALLPIPDAIPPRRAILAANMETALNAVWDGGVGPGMRIAIVGAGVVGCLIARLCTRMPGMSVEVSDPAPGRDRIIWALGATPVAQSVDADIVFHTSATSTGLATALAAAGREASIVELSWYGADAPAAPLGQAFHSQRLRLISSQVGEVAPSQRARWNHRDRLEKALSLLDDPALDILLGAAFAFDELPDRLDEIFAEPTLLCPVVRYSP